MSDQMTVSDGKSDPAGPPPGLEPVLDLLNTVDVDSGVEELATPDLLRDWLSSRRLIRPSDRISETDRRRAVAVRDGLRGLVAAAAGERVDSRLTKQLNREAARARLTLRFVPGGRAELEAEPAGIDRAIGAVLAAVYAATANGTWERVKVCRRHSCQWAFYDRSRNRSRSWCSMAVCGNRTKAELFRERHRA